MNVSNEYDDEELVGASPASINWFQENMDMEQADAFLAAEIFLEYSKRGDTPLHENTNIEGNDLLDSIIHNPMAPVYSGEQHRGIYIDKDVLSKLGVNNVAPEQYVDSIINSGLWKEPGATSFSASETTARSFARLNWGVEAGEVSILVHYTGGRSGFPMRHLSSYPDEDEVLHSRRQMSKGLKIYNHTKERHSDGGTVYHIYVND